MHTERRIERGDRLVELRRRGQVVAIVIHDLCGEENDQGASSSAPQCCRIEQDRSCGRWRFQLDGPGRYPRARQCGESPGRGFCHRVESERFDRRSRWRLRNNLRLEECLLWL